MRRTLAVSIACTTWILAVPAFADDDPAVTAKSLEKQKKPADAADVWEKAYETTKTPKYLYFAGRDRQKAAAPSRAANDYARYLAAAPPAEKKERGAAQKALTALTPKLGRFAIRASGSSKMTVDGEVVDPALAENWFVTVGPHTVEATFGKAKATEQGTAVAGQQVAIVVAAPPEEEQNPEAPATATADSPTPTSSSASSGPSKPFEKPLPPLAVYIGGGVTVVLAAVTVVSALGVQSDKSTFDKAKTADNLSAGKSAQTRTNILLVATGIGAVATAGMAIFLVDWKKAGITGGLGPTSAFVRGTF